MPMTRKKVCSHCGAPAATFVAYVKSGQVWNASYCHFHAVKEGVMHPHSYGLLDRGTIKGPQAPEPACCTGCGMTKRDFECRGRMGCASCYEAFAPLLKPLLGKFHRGTRHIGKVPRKATVVKLLSAHLEKLQLRLSDAIASERFEEAAAVRDEMHRVRNTVKKRQTLQLR